MFFESRDTRLATVSWHPRYKERYRTKAQAQEPKRLWEEKGRILRLGECMKLEAAPRRRREVPAQEELRS